MIYNKEKKLLFNKHDKYIYIVEKLKNGKL